MLAELFSTVLSAYTANRRGAAENNARRFEAEQLEQRAGQYRAAAQRGAAGKNGVVQPTLSRRFGPEQVGEGPIRLSCVWLGHRQGRRIPGAQRDLPW